MAYESDSFKEHHLVRIPVLEKLVKLKWEREQIICPSEDSSDKEWRVPKSPSEAANREARRSFKGYPVDIAIFDSIEYAGEYEHIQIIIECKEPEKENGISQLKIYLGLEPHARLGVWTNGKECVRIYKLPTAGKFKVIEHSSLPKPSENLIFPDEKPITYDDMETPDIKELKQAFVSILNTMTSRDSHSTRREDQLNQISDILLIKLDSDREAEWDKKEPVQFQLDRTPRLTSERINRQYREYKNEHPTLFSDADGDQVLLDDDTIQDIVLRIQLMNIGAMAPEALSIAFQVFRDAALKLGDGQYYTPLPVIEVGTKMMCLTHKDIIIDPACGTGGFLSEAMMAVSESQINEKAVVQWAHYKLFGVDRDETNIKLTRALMVGIGDGSTNAHHGDSLRSSKWKDDKTGIRSVLSDERYTVVLTNPPFGKGLVINSSDARASQFSICKHTKNGLPSDEYAPTTELGIAFVERSWRLLQNGGRLGIILPETYFFSKSYTWFREWLDEHFILRGVLNIPMEAFQGFCRAKTNFYVFEKIGKGDKAPSPAWFKDGYTWVSNAPTIGLNKDGMNLYIVDENGNRTKKIDNKALLDVDILTGNSLEETMTASYIPYKKMLESYNGVPVFSEDRSDTDLAEKIKARHPELYPVTLGELIDKSIIKVRQGHGSPSLDIRNGDIPYIKVVDLRAGRINPNNTNMVSESVAKRFWKGDNSGLHAYEICTPSRASKNIGEPCMIMPGQEKMVLTKEILVFSVCENAPIDSFYLFWALNLSDVLKQWKRVVFMQTNREDLGDRYRYITIPYTDDPATSATYAADYKKYFMGLEQLEKKLHNINHEL